MFDAGRSWVRDERDRSEGERREFCTNVLAYFILIRDTRETRDWKGLLAEYVRENQEKYPALCKRLLDELDDEL